MPKIEIYTTPTCGYCHRAKRLLQSKDVSFTEIDVTTDPNARPEMIARSQGARTVPQIFIDGQHIGGSDDLAALDRAGKLDPLLNA